MLPFDHFSFVISVKDKEGLTAMGLHPSNRVSFTTNTVFSLQTKLANGKW